MLARSYTGRNLVLKIGGGWHGAQPWGLVGVGYGEQGYRGYDSEGLPYATLNEVLVTRFNDCQALEQVFRSHGDQIACFIVEPVIGAGGLYPGHARVPDPGAPVDRAARRAAHPRRGDRRVPLPGRQRGRSCTASSPT